MEHKISAVAIKGSCSSLSPLLLLLMLLLMLPPPSSSSKLLLYDRTMFTIMRGSKGGIGVRTTPGKSQVLQAIIGIFTWTPTTPGNVGPYTARCWTPPPPPPPLEPWKIIGFFEIKPLTPPPLCITVNYKINIKKNIDRTFLLSFGPGTPPPPPRDENSWICAWQYQSGLVSLTYKTWTRLRIALAVHTRKV